MLQIDPTQISSRRSLLLMAMGAITGLMLSGYSLFTARGTSTLYVPPEDVAIVNQQPISRVDYIVQLQALYGVDLLHATVVERRKVLDDMIREELFVQRGKELDVALSDPEVRSAMVNAVELEIAADAISSRPDDAKLNAFYQSHAANYASEGVMSYYDYVAPTATPETLTAARTILRKAMPASDSLSQLGFKARRNLVSDEYYFAAKIHLGDRIFDAASKLTDGQSSAAVLLPDGLHVIYMVNNVPPIPQSFATARDHVLNDYRKDGISRLRSGDESYLRKRANVLIADDIR